MTEEDEMKAWFAEWTKRGPEQARRIIDAAQGIAPSAPEAIVALLVAAHSLAHVTGLPFRLFVELVEKAGPKQLQQ